MKSLFRFITLLLCIELIVGPVSPNVSLLVGAARAEQSCPTGMQFDSNLNRCLTKDETARVMNATASCNGDADCIKRNAVQEFEKKVSAGEAPDLKSSGGFMSTIGNAAAVAGPLSIAVGGMSKLVGRCATASFYAMVAGSLAFVVGDNWANYQHSSRLSKIKEDWGKIVNPTDANGDKDKIREVSATAQSQSFEMLAKAEDSMSQAATFKKNLYMIAGVAYLAAGVIAGVEILASKTNPIEAARTLCPQAAAPTPTPVFIESGSLFQSYASNSRQHFLDHRFLSNLKSSQDLASFLMNQRATTMTHSSPTINEYEEIAEGLRGSKANDQTAFEVFKEFSLAAISSLSPIPSAHADSEGDKKVDTNAAEVFRKHETKGIDFMGIGLGVVAGAALGYFIGDKMVTPEARAIMSGVMAGMSFVMMSQASSQADASKKRAALLRKMKAELDGATGAITTCKSEDRSDPGKPDCYCYTPENQRNSARNNSTVCKNLWAGKNLTETNYLAKGVPNAKICINNQNKADTACSCRTTNTCMKVSAGQLTGVGAGTMSMLNAGLSPLNQLADGSVSAGNVNAGALASQAARLSALQKKVDANPNLAGHNKNKKKATADLERRLSAEAGRLGVTGSGLLGNNSSNMPTNAGEAARALERELDGQTSPNTVSGNTQAVGGGAGRAQPETLEFGLSPEDAALQSNQVAAAMNQELDYSASGSDISSSSVNIFEVLTIRYQRSGMRRLFEEPRPATPSATGAPATRPSGP